jgi:hypothetical protein
MADARDTGQRHFGIRDLLGHVNLRDFAHMVSAEVAMLGSSTRIAFEAIRHGAFGPLIFLAAMLMVFLRLILLVLVVIFFGGAIVLITAVRALARLRRGRSPSSS